jgi:hypothetical protein
MFERLPSQSSSVDLNEARDAAAGSVDLPITCCSSLAGARGAELFASALAASDGAETMSVTAEPANTRRTTGRVRGGSDEVGKVDTPPCTGASMAMLVAGVMLDAGRDKADKSSELMLTAGAPGVAIVL